MNEPKYTLIEQFVSEKVGSLDMARDLVDLARGFVALAVFGASVAAAFITEGSLRAVYVLALAVLVGASGIRRSQG